MIENIKIQNFEKELRKYNSFNKELLKYFLKLNIENETLKNFLNSQYGKPETFDSLFGKEHQRNDMDYVEDIMKYSFKTPITLRNKILKFMKQNNIEMLPYEKVDLTLYCDGKIKLNNNHVDAFSAIQFLRDLKRDRITCKTTFMPIINLELFNFMHIDFKKYYFTKEIPRKLNKKENNEITKLFDKTRNKQLNQKELNRLDELEQIDNKRRYGKIKYIYKIKDNEHLVIDKLWKFSELEKLLNGLRLSLSSKVREILLSKHKYKKSGKYKFQDYTNGICNFFDNLREFSNISDKIKDIRKNIENNKEVDTSKIDNMVNIISKFMFELNDLFFLDMDNYLTSHKYKFDKFI